MEHLQYGYRFEFRQYGDLRYLCVADYDHKVRLGQMVVTKGNHCIPDGTKGIVFDIRIATVPIHARSVDGKYFTCKLTEIDWDETAKLHPVRRRNP